MKINFDFQDILVPTSLDRKKNDEVTTSENSNINSNLKTSSANDFHAFEGQMRKLQLFDYLTLFDFE